MANEIDDGGPAFPSQATITSRDGITGDAVYSDPVPGMSLRDYFAGQLLLGAELRERDFAGDFSKFCQACYRVADAMIAARKSDAS